MNPFEEGKHMSHGKTENDEIDNLSMSIKIRHTPDFCAAVVTPLPDGRLDIHTVHPLQGVAPGQFCVFYDNEHHRCYGSGEIRLT